MLSFINHIHNKRSTFNVNQFETSIRHILSFLKMQNKLHVCQRSNTTLYLFNRYKPESRLIHWTVLKQLKSTRRSNAHWPFVKAVNSPRMLCLKMVAQTCLLMFQVWCNWILRIMFFSSFLYYCLNCLARSLESVGLGNIVSLDRSMLGMYMYTFIPTTMDIERKIK